jgi:hypothetical protein
MVLGLGTSARVFIAAAPPLALVGIANIIPKVCLVVLLLILVTPIATTATKAEHFSSKVLTALQS